MDLKLQSWPFTFYLLESFYRWQSTTLFLASFGWWYSPKTI